MDSMQPEQRRVSSQPPSVHSLPAREDVNHLPFASSQCLVRSLLRFSSQRVCPTLSEQMMAVAAVKCTMPILRQRSGMRSNRLDIATSRGRIKSRPS